MIPLNEPFSLRKFCSTLDNTKLQSSTISKLHYSISDRWNHCYCTIFLFVLLELPRLYLYPPLASLDSTSLIFSFVMTIMASAEPSWRLTTFKDFCNRKDVQALHQLSNVGEIDVLQLSPERQKTQITMRMRFGPTTNLSIRTSHISIRG